eukprot:5092257-Alexandrium_andersonii.AAC.1
MHACTPSSSAAKAILRGHHLARGVRVRQVAAPLRPAHAERAAPRAAQDHLAGLAGSPRFDGRGGLGGGSARARGESAT